MKLLNKINKQWKAIFTAQEIFRKAKQGKIITFTSADQATKLEMYRSPEHEIIIMKFHDLIEGDQWIYHVILRRWKFIVFHSLRKQGECGFIAAAFVLAKKLGKGAYWYAAAK